MKEIIEKLKLETGGKLNDFDYDHYGNILDQLFLEKASWSQQTISDFFYNSMVLVTYIGSEKLFEIIGLSADCPQMELRNTISRFEMNLDRSKKLRALEFEQFTAVFDKIYQSTIIECEDLPYFSYLSSSDVSLLYGVLKWSIDYIITKRIPHKKFSNNLFINFGFTKEFSEYIYNKINKNKSDLFQYALFGQINSINERVQKLQQQIDKLT